MTIGSTGIVGNSGRSRRFHRAVLGRCAVCSAAGAAIALTCALLPGVALSQPSPAASATTAAPATSQAVSILLVRELTDALPPLSLLDLPPKDDGIAGAKLAIDDNNTTGRFLNQSFALDTLENSDAAALVAETVARVDKGAGFVIADVLPATLLALSDALKRWRRWLLVTGTMPEDKLYAEALRRAAKRFGHKIVEEREFKYEVGSRRADGGYEQIQQQIPSFLQGAADHDVLIVADAGSLFADYFPYRTWEARPVAGSAGLTASSWHPAVELWGGTQFQNRFKRLANRNMRPLDYNVWVAVRSVGEAATRRRSADPKELIAYMLTPEFEIAAFKGRKLTYRSWNGQLRQPLLVTTDKLHVTVSPQPEFLHQFSELDTLGVDKPETKCQAYGK